MNVMYRDLDGGEIVERDPVDGVPYGAIRRDTVEYPARPVVSLLVHGNWKAAATTAQFHLQGQHDQKTHGNRGGAPAGYQGGLFNNAERVVEIIDPALRDGVRRLEWLSEEVIKELDKYGGFMSSYPDPDRRPEVKALLEAVPEETAEDISERIDRIIETTRDAYRVNEPLVGDKAAKLKAEAEGLRDTVRSASTIKFTETFQVPPSPDAEWVRDGDRAVGPITLTDIPDGVSDAHIQTIMTAGQRALEANPHLKGVPVTIGFGGDRMGENTLGYVAVDMYDSGSRSWRHVHLTERYLDDENLRIGLDDRPDLSMASSNLVDGMRWTVMHEMGHVALYERGRARGESMDDKVNSSYDIVNRNPLISAYGRTSTVEAHAEAFAEWANTGGTTNNPAVQWFAREFGWTVPDSADIVELAAHVGRSATLAIEMPSEPAEVPDTKLILPSQVSAVFDTVDGPRYEWIGNDTATFHLQGQHDQKTHGNRAARSKSTVFDDFAEPPVGYRPEATERWRQAHAYLKENGYPEWWTGVDIYDTDGLPVGHEVPADWGYPDILEVQERYREMVGPDIADGVWSIGRGIEHARRSAIQEAISMNEIELDAAKERYGYRADPERGEWETLPDRLFHATSALSAIEESGGLKTRAEIGGRGNAAGLGGGSEDTISFTSDYAIAEGISRSLHEVRRAVNMSNDDLVAALSERAGDWWPDVQASARSVHGKDVPETVADRYNLYRSYTAFRERKEGILDPLFFNVDPDRLAAMDPNEIGIVTVEPAVDGARGYQVSALGEWRIPTGRAVTVIANEREDDLGEFTTIDAMTEFRIRRVEFRFDPSQPRVPAGSSGGGRWTDGAGGGANAAPAATPAASESPSVASGPVSDPVEVSADNVESIVDNRVQRRFDEANGVTGDLRDRDDFETADGDYWSDVREQQMAESDDPEAQIIGRYAQDSSVYSAMNQALRGQTEASSDVRADIDALGAVIDGATPTTEPITTYRGIGAGIFPDDLPVGTEVDEPGFLSTSYSKMTVSMNFDQVGGDILEIVAPAGTKAIVGNSYEKEILFGSGSMKIVAVEDKPGRSGGRIIKVELV